MIAGGHGPRTVGSLGCNQERNGSLDLRPVVLHPRETEDVQCLPGGISVAGQVLDLTPTAVGVLPIEGLVDPRLKSWLTLARADVQEQPEGCGLRGLRGPG